MRRATENDNTGIKWDRNTELEDLDFADDIALLSNQANKMQEKTDKVDILGRRIGLKINKKKTDFMFINKEIVAESN